MDTIKTINAEEVRSVINGIPSGTFIRVQYVSYPDMNAKSKKDGAHITKITETTVRVGIDYNAVKAVKDYKETHEVEERDYSSWENEEGGRIVTVPSTGNTLVRVYKVPKYSNTKSSFIISDKNGTRTVEKLSDEDKALFQPSYFKKKTGDKVVDAFAESTQKININNFVRIEKVVAG